MINCGCCINWLIILKIVKRDILVHWLCYLRCHVEGARYCSWHLHWGIRQVNLHTSNKREFFYEYILYREFFYCHTYSFICLHFIPKRMILIHIYLLILNSFSPISKKIPIYFSNKLLLLLYFQNLHLSYNTFMILENHFPFNLRKNVSRYFSNKIKCHIWIGAKCYILFFSFVVENGSTFRSEPLT